MDWEHEEQHAVEVEQALLRSGLARRVDPDSGEDADRWTACDLASVVEGCFHVTIDPDRLSPRERMRWLDRLADSYEVPDPALDRVFLRYLWLLEGGEPVGTLALPVSSLGRLDLPVWSLWIHPAHRRRGVAARVLRAAHDAARHAGMRGVRVDTHWVWQRAVRFYLAQRMWVVSWKRSIGFSWIHDLPRYEIIDAPGRVTLAVRARGELTPWLTATREDDRLVLHETHHEGQPLAHATLGLALAVRGWPLVRSPEHWARRHRSMDIGEVEGLAAKIVVFEDLARAWRWDVRTPTIPHELDR